MADDTEQAGDGPSRLDLAGVSPDRRHLQLVDDQGTEFTLAITPELRIAVRGEAPRRMEIKMSSSIRPREIQTRIRAGEPADVVAEAAGTTVEAIMAYVGPVLAERAHVAERAQRASVRRTPGESATAHTQSRVLGDAVAAHLRGLGSDPAEVTWDAYRRETGRWVLTGAYSAAERSGTARFTYDAPGNYVLADNDDARWLLGDVVAVVPEARDDLRNVRERRLSAVPADDELPLGTADLDEPLPWDGDPEPASAPVADEPIRTTAQTPAAEEPDDADSDAAAEREAEQARHRRAVQKKRGRASVPSWDEIMFGGGDQG